MNLKIAILGVLSCVRAMALAEEAKNLVSAAGGFENPGDEKQIVGGWRGKFAVGTEEEKHGGSFALKLPALAEDERKSVEAEHFADGSLFLPGDELEFSLYVKCTATLGPGSHPRARLIFASPDWKKQVDVTLELPSAPRGDWEKACAKIAVPAEFQEGWHVKIQIANWIEGKPEVAGAIYVDDIAVTAPSAAKEPAANEAVKPAAVSGPDTTSLQGDGKLVVCFASKGDYRHTPGSAAGLNGLAGLLHKYGYRGTYYLKPSTVEACQAELQEWHKTHGDEVGWFSDGESLAKAVDEVSRLRALLPGQKIRSAGHVRYGAPWVKVFEENGVESVWGRCYEQTATDGITDRGCPFGFYYARPDCFKVPNPADGGVISVPWLSNDLNLVFRTAQQSTFTFDPNDPQDIGVATPGDDSFWRAELKEYKRQTKYNKVVPLVIQQEIGEFDFSTNTEWRTKGAAILENLLKILKEEGIEVVTVSEAVDMFKAAYPNSTQPTYGVFGNIATHTPIIKANKSLQPVPERFAVAKKEQYKCFGPTFNGFYATGRLGRTWYYYEPGGGLLDAFGKNFSYYDKNGLLVFIEGNPSPARITPYGNLPKDAFSTAILPEMSGWFDTDQFIPQARVTTRKADAGVTVSVAAAMVPNIIFSGETLPYGVMLWGDYSAYAVPANAPVGTKILADEGVFIPMTLKAGENSLALEFPLNSGK